LAHVILHREASCPSRARPALDGKFLRAGGERLWAKGVTYGTFSPDGDGRQFPCRSQVAADFAIMRRAGINTVRTYTAPDHAFLDVAAEHGLRVMVGLAWTQHVAFLDDRRTCADIRANVMAGVRALSSHPAVLMFALGNEIPATVVRWLGRERVERFLQSLYEDAKAAAPDGLFTYVNYPPTEYLHLPFLDLLAFNVYLHEEHALRAYLAHLQNLAGHKPLLIAEAGADSLREGPAGQAALASMHIGAAFAEGACGAIAFAFTDEWWRGGSMVDDWCFGLVDRARRPKPALEAVERAYADAPFPRAVRGTWPTVSVVVCAHDAADTIDECLASLERLTYPDVEVIVVNDGSRDDTGERSRRYAGVTVIDLAHAGLSAARNAGLSAATGEIVAYLDADAFADPDWLTYLIQPFLTSAVVGSGGPNVVPPEDPWVAQCVARAPGGPTHVLLDERTAEHVPGCNMAFLRNALSAIGGFNPIYVRAGDDVDVCWRLQARGWKIGFAPAALVWHHHRASVRGYWRQQMGYGEGQAWLVPHHPDKFWSQRIAWRGRIYSPLPFLRVLSSPHVNTGVWGTAAFPSVYHRDAPPLTFLPHTVRWQIACVVLVAAGLAAWLAAAGPAGSVLLAAGAAGLAVTAVRCVRYARASDVESLPPLGGRSRPTSRAIYRALIAWLHLIQPLARAHGQVRGFIRPPHPGRASRSWSTRFARPSPKSAWRALYLFGRGAAHTEFWSERWITADLLLTRLTDRFRGSHMADTLEIDDGWQAERDLRVRVGWFAWLDLRVLVEDHEGGRHLVRVGRRLRTVPLSAAVLLAGLFGLAASVEAGPWASSSAGAVVCAVVALVFGGRIVWRTSSTLAETDRVIADLMGDLELMPMSRGAIRPQEEPRWST
jgi:GT2 family glycosyltransferase